MDPSNFEKIIRIKRLIIKPNNKLELEIRMAHPNHYTTRLGAPSEHESLMITSQGVAESHSRCACQRQCRGCLGKFSNRILMPCVGDVKC